jgi:hypothetical protein
MCRNIFTNDTIHLGPFFQNYVYLVSFLVDYNLICNGQCHLWITICFVMYRTVSFLVDCHFICNVQDSVISYGLQFDLYDL